MDEFDNAFSDLVPDANGVPTTGSNTPGFDDLIPPARTKSESVLRGLKMFSRGVLEGAAKIPAGAADLAGTAGNFVGNTLGRADAALSGREHTPQQFFPTGNVEHLESQYNRFMPSPETRAEQYALDATEFGVGASSGVGVGASLSKSANPTTRRVAEILMDSPGMQVAAGASAATGSNIAEDAGAGPVGQAAAGIAGGFIAPVAGVASGRTLAGAGRTVAGVKDAMTQSGQRKIVGNVMDDSAVNAERARNNIIDADAFGTGVSGRTTGEASRDPGLLTLERAARSLDTKGRFSQKMSEANEARHKILDVLGGDDVAALKAARNTKTGPMREAAMTPDPDVNVAPIVERIDTLLANPGVRGQKTVSAALNEFRERIANAKTAQELYGIRKDVNLAVGGKLSGERQDYRHATAQLMKVKDGIDEAIERVAPGFRRYLNEYAKLSREIDQQESIQRIQSNARLAASDPYTGRDVLSQAKFRRLVEKEMESGVLTDEQATVLQAISDDLDIGAAINSANIRPPGSDTAKNLTVAHIIGRAIGGQSDSPLLHTLIRPLRWVTSYSEEQVQGILVEAMLEPKLARILMAEAKPAQINRLNRSLTEILGVSTVGATAASMPESQNQPEQQ